MDDLELPFSLESETVILAGYSARETDYPKHVAEFEKLLSEIDLVVPEGDE